MGGVVLVRRGVFHVPRPSVTIYFAASISGGRGDQAVYRQIIDLLKQHGTVLTEHFGDATLTSAGEDLADCVIHDRDLEWLRSSDVLVAEVTTPSLGVGYEIGRAVEWGKRVICLYRPSAGRRLSGMIAGCAGVVVREYSDTAQLTGTAARGAGYFLTAPPSSSSRRSRSPEVGALYTESAFRTTLPLWLSSKPRRPRASVTGFLNSITDDERRKDSKALVEMMTKATKAKPVMWGPRDHRFRRSRIYGREGQVGQMVQGRLLSAQARADVVFDGRMGQGAAGETRGVNHQRELPLRQAAR